MRSYNPYPEPADNENAFRVAGHSGFPPEYEHFFNKFMTCSIADSPDFLKGTSQCLPSYLGEPNTRDNILYCDNLRHVEYPRELIDNINACGIPFRRMDLEFSVASSMHIYSIHAMLLGKIKSFLRSNSLEQAVEKLATPFLQLLMRVLLRDHGLPDPDEVKIPSTLVVVL